MLTYVRLDGTELHDYTTGDGHGHRDLTRVAGLVGLSAPRGSSTANTEQHGTTNRNRWLGSKIITLEGECWGVTHADAYAQFDEVADAFYRTLTDPAGKLIEWPRPDGIALRARVKLVGDVAPPLEEGGAVLVWQAQVEQMDPRAYSQTLDTVVGADLSAGGGGLMFPFTPPLDFDESAGGIATVTNDGKLETPPVVRIYGPVTSPRYVLDSSEVGVKIIGEVASGDYLEIDHAKRTVKLNGTTRRMNLLDTLNSQFFDVPTGVHTVRLLALNYGAGAHLRVETRDAHGG